MIVVIQCAGTKQPRAGRLARRDGKPVKFVADPDGAPQDNAVAYARPDDISDRGVSWRDLLLAYNREPGDNPDRLLPAWQLYRNDVYARLAGKLGVGKLYILSAGWGLIAGSFLTPDYDITFSNMKPENRYKRRGKRDCYKDLAMLPADTREPIVFFGGKEYLPHFAQLTASVKGTRTVFYNSNVVPNIPGCVLRRFDTDANTNWHYLCANAFLAGEVTVD
jgi:hypothetical protein